MIPDTLQLHRPLPVALAKKPAPPVRPILGLESPFPVLANRVLIRLCKGVKRLEHPVSQGPIFFNLVLPVLAVALLGLLFSVSKALQLEDPAVQVWESGGVYARVH